MHPSWSTARDTATRACAAAVVVGADGKMVLWLTDAVERVTDIRW
jgi:hypothetical protein